MQVDAVWFPLREIYCVYICSISVMVTPRPSKALLTVRVRYTAPRAYVRLIAAGVQRTHAACPAGQLRSGYDRVKRAGRIALEKPINTLVSRSPKNLHSSVNNVTNESPQPKRVCPYLYGYNGNGMVILN